MVEDRIGVFINGEIVQSRRKEDFYKYSNSLGVSQLLGIKNISRGIVEHIDPQNGIGRISIKGKGLAFSFDLRCPLAPGDEGSFLIRPEEVMVIREGKPIKESLRGNIFEVEIGKIIERETHHTLLLTEVGQGAVLEADIPSYILRNVKLVEDQRVRAALRRESLWVMPGRDNSPAVGCE